MCVYVRVHTWATYTPYLLYIIIVFVYDITITSISLVVVIILSLFLTKSIVSFGLRSGSIWFLYNGILWRRAWFQFRFLMDSFGFRVMYVALKIIFFFTCKHHVLFSITHNGIRSFTSVFSKIPAAISMRRFHYIHP